MKITDLLKKESIDINLMPLSKHETIKSLIFMIESTGSITDTEEFTKAVLTREALITTGIGDGVAIPHGKSPSVRKTELAAAVCRDGMEYEAIDGEPTYLIFMIASPDKEDAEHLSLLSKLSTMLIDEDFRHKLINSQTKEEFIANIDAQERKKFPYEYSDEYQSNKGESQAEQDYYELIAVTACPTGIAHTYMAAEKLALEAEKRGMRLKVETNGSCGVKDLLTKEDIKNAKAVIVAADTKIDTNRFKGKKLVMASSGEAIHKAGELIDRALADNKDKYDSKKISGQIYMHLMNGISYMLPFVIGGGILIALSFLLDDYSLSLKGLGSNTEISNFLKSTGDMAFSFMLPVFSGYIAFSIGDRPSLAAGFTGGMIASQAGSGFLGAIAAGFLAGYITQWLKQILSGAPKLIEGMKTVLIYPVFSILITSGIMVFIVNPPLGLVNRELSSFLTSMPSQSRILMGILVAAMMAVDMGGPVNKAAYVFGIASIESGNYEVMASVMAGGMVPPLAIALAVTLYKKGFTDDEREAGFTNYIMGLSFITEGAIPFAAADPLRIIVPSTLGAALAGGISMAFGCTLRAPHGGIFVVPIMGERLGYLIAIGAGSLVGALLIVTLKKRKKVFKNEERSCS
ncbi:PTS fructose transporter subunit IIABC [Proteocatella sphenisci]|uniref:PTS fructose transporter subunit IIABC n=1 Tax=Proteocatella sphenisci TaxID=181070 RepID=UPI00048BE490|nr:PTS fructose transporter subunit IIABC [Proteocatella sphenisci]